MQDRITPDKARQYHTIQYYTTQDETLQDKPSQTMT